MGRSSLVTDNYCNGSYKRDVLKGSFLYTRFFFEDIFIDKPKGNSVIKDYLAEEYLNNLDLQSYYSELDNIFIDFANFNNLTNEEVYGYISRLRKQHLPKSYYDDKYKRDIDKAIEMLKVKKISTRDILLDLAYDPNKNRGKLEIDRSDFLLNKLSLSKGVVFIPSETIDLASIFRLIKTFKTNKKSYIFIKGNKVREEPILKEFNAIIESDIELKNLYDNKTIELISYENDAIGLDLNNLTDYTSSLLIDKENLIIGSGEDILFSLDQSNLDYFIISKIERVASQFYTNFTLDSKEQLPSIISYIPKGYTVARDFFGTERPLISLYHFDKIYFGGYKEEDLLANKDNLMKLEPELYANFYSTKFNKKTEKRRKFKSKKDLLSYGDKVKGQLAESEFEARGIDYIDCYYDLSSFDERNYTIETTQESNGVLIRGALIKKESKLNAQIVLAEDYSTGIIGVREVLKNEEFSKDFYLYNNFLYFFSNNLVRMYNENRISSPKEQINFKDFYLGYKYEKGKKETFPLYNKGYIAFNLDGSVSFGRKELGAGSITINKVNIKFEEEDINNFDKDISIITPHLLTKQNIKVDNFRQFKYYVGRDRFNIIIVDDQIIAIRHGEVQLPSVGAIISLSYEKAKSYGFLNLDIDSDGYYDLAKLDSKKVLIQLEKDEEERKVKLILGGATLLVKDGINLVGDEEEAKRNFEVEGWYNPLSMQTQETQVQNWVRGPRSVIGKTIDDQLFILTFSGRHFETAGARFDEIVKITQKKLGPIKDLLNLDGGASVCSAMILNRDVFELNVPAPCDFTARGMVRPVNSMILLDFHKNKD